MTYTRPSTSAGRRVPSSAETSLDRRRSKDDALVGAHLQIAAAVDKRVSRDDMYVGNPSSDARSAAFHIPLRTQPATFGQGPDSGGTVPAHLVATGSPVLEDEQIGMALGSPIHSPIQSYGQQRQQQQQQQSSWPEPSIPTSDGQVSTYISSNNSATRPDGPVTTTTSPPNASMQRSKSTRRKLFGFFGSKRQADARTVPLPGPVPVPVPVPAPAAMPKNSLDAGDGSSATVASTVASPAMAPQASVSSPKTLERSTTRGKSQKYQPIVIPPEPEPSASVNAPAATGLKASQSVRSKRPFLRSKASEPAIRKQPDMPSLAPASTAAQCIPGASPYLNVEIPEASMERYSVMFGGLLNCNPSASSLLARRQATVNRLKTINDQSNIATAADGLLQVGGGGLQRRATSPSFNKSPSFSPFPSQSSSASRQQPTLGGNAGLQSHRMRSNTTPAVAHSPIQPDFDTHKVPAQPSSQPSQRHAHSLRDNPCGLARKVSNTSQMGVAVTTMPTERSVVCFDPDQSSLILESPTEMMSPVDDCIDRSETTRDFAAFKPVIKEPQWQMISPPSTGSSHGSVASKLARDGKDSTTTSPASEISIATELQVDEPDSALKSAVEISIARQISISRQQRDMLRPLQAGNAKGGTPGAPSMTRTATLKLGRNERLQETKAATPTLVVLGGEAEPSYSYSSSSSSGGNGNAQAQSQQARPGKDQNEQQNLHNLSPRSNANGAGSLHAYQLAQNRKSEQVILEAA